MYAVIVRLHCVVLKLIVHEELEFIYEEPQKNIKKIIKLLKYTSKHLTIKLFDRCTQLWTPVNSKELSLSALKMIDGIFKYYKICIVLIKLQEKIIYKKEIFKFKYYNSVLYFIHY